MLRIRRWLQLEVDTGADISQVKKSALSKSINVNSAEKKNLGGTFGDSSMTQVSMKVEQDPLGVPIKFHVIKDNGKLPSDGVLGRDNMWNRSVLNFYKNELLYVDNSQTEILKLPMVSLASINTILQRTKAEFKSRRKKSDKVKANTMYFELCTTRRCL